MSVDFVTMNILLSSLLLPRDPQGSSRISIFRGLLFLTASLAAELPGFLRSASCALSSLCFSRHSSSSLCSSSSLAFFLCLLFRHLVGFFGSAPGVVFGLDPVSVLIWMVMLVIGSLADVEVESVPVVVFGLDLVFVAGAASGGGL